MTKPFNKETPSYKSEAAQTPYARAKQEWDGRFGNLAIQASNWRIVAFIALTFALILLVALLVSFFSKESKVYVAEVSSTGRVVNIAPLTTQYQPNVAQEKYFIVHVIKLIRELSLDPVVAKRNWLAAYNFLTKRSSQQLNAYFKNNNPAAMLGKKTITVEITDINPISTKTFQVDWVETIVDSEGTSSQQKYSGVFTITIKQPANERQILQNPLGIYVVDFNITTRNAGQ